MYIQGLPNSLLGFEDCGGPDEEETQRLTRMNTCRILMGIGIGARRMDSGVVDQEAGTRLMSGHGY